MASPANAPIYPSKDPGRSRGRIKTEFISSVLRQTADRIMLEQNRVAEAWNLFKEDGSGDLKRSLQGNFSINAAGEGGKLRFRYLTYFRFLDMPDPRRKIRQAKREGYHLYNRIMFGNIYNYAVPELMWGFTNEVRDEMIDILETSMTASDRYHLLSERLDGAIYDKDRFIANLLTRMKK